MNVDLSGQRILITGAAKRVGRILALACARSGADLVIHYGSSEADAASLRDEIAALGRQAHLVKADLSDPAGVERILPQALAGGPVTALVNNASIFEPITWDAVTLADWNRTLMINLTAPFLLSQAFARAFLQSPAQGQGRILNLLDWRALRPGPDYLPYTISKSALAGLTRSLAAALAPRICVNGLALGAILPPVTGEPTDGILDPVPAKRWASQGELEEAALFFLGGPAYVTGEVLHLDGGRHLA